MVRSRRWVTYTAALVAVAALVIVALYAVRWHAARFDPGPLETYYRLLGLRSAQPVDTQRLRDGIRAAAGYIKRVTDDTGQFTYLANTNPDVKVPPGYSMLRHAGTIYSLGMAHAVSPDPDIVAAMQRAVDFMRRCCYTRFEDEGMLGIWEPPEVVHAQGPPEYKLGGAGLALAALVSLDVARPGSVPVDEMRGLARMGQFLQRWNGEFYSKYVPSRGGRSVPGGVIYYPGEMALGWMMLHERHPSRDLVDSTVSALGFLARERAEAGEAPADHWALLATARLFQAAEREGLDIPRETLFNHALQIIHTILEGGYAPALLPSIEGTLVSAGRGGVTPTATRLEGLLAALSFLPPSHPITPHVESAVHRGLDFVLRAQLKDGPHAGGIPSAMGTLPDDGTDMTARFNEQATEIRIDYVQHALSAIVQYVAWTTGLSARPS